MEDVTANRRRTKELEDNLLFRLTSTKGSLVDDDDLINVLSVTKVTAYSIFQQSLVLLYNVTSVENWESKWAVSFVGACC